MLKYISFTVLLFIIVFLSASCGGLGGSGGAGITTVGNANQPSVPQTGVAPVQSPNASPSPATAQNILGGDNKYVVYKSSGNSQEPSLSNIIVLGANVPPPTGYAPDSSIKIIIIDPNGTAVDAQVEGNGTFNLDNISTGLHDALDVSVIDTGSGEGTFIQLPVLDIIDKGTASVTNGTSGGQNAPVTNTASPLTTPVTVVPTPVSTRPFPQVDPNGKPVPTMASAVSTPSVAKSTDQLLRIKIFPDVKAVLKGESVFYRAVGIDTNGKKVKPSNIKWSSNVTPVSGDPSTAIFTPTSVDDKVEIMAWVPDPNNLDNSDKALQKTIAMATVIDGSTMTKVTGTIYDTDGTKPLGNSLVLFDAPSPSLDYIPLKRVCMTGNEGKYTVHLIQNLLYNVSFSNSSDKKIYRGNPGNIKVPDGQDITQVINRTPTIYTSSFKTPLPVDQYIEDAWSFVTRVTDMPMPGLYMDMSPIINNPSEPKDGRVTKGEFSGGTYALTKDSNNKWSIVLINYQNHKEAKLSCDDTKYKGELFFNPFEITNEKNTSYTVSIRQDEWTLNDKTYTGSTKYYSSGQKDKLLAVSDFTWTLNDDMSIDQTTDLWTPNKAKKTGKFVIKRTSGGGEEHSDSNVLYSYTGYMESYLYDSTNTTNISKTVKWELTEGYINSDLTGKFDVQDTTTDGLYKGTHIVINIDREKQGNINDEVRAHGDVYRNGDASPYAIFSIYTDGLIQATNKTTGSRTKFNL